MEDVVEDVTVSDINLTSPNTSAVQIACNTTLTSSGNVQLPPRKKRSIYSTINFAPQTSTANNTGNGALYFLLQWSYQDNLRF